MIQIHDDSGKPVWFLNRWLVVVRARPPFVDWANQLDYEDPPLTVEQANASPTTFLIPDFEFTEEARAWVEENFSLLFGVVLGLWDQDETHWPPDRSWSVGRDWFDLELLEPPWDLVDEPHSSTFQDVWEWCHSPGLQIEGQSQTVIDPSKNPARNRTHALGEKVTVERDDLSDVDDRISVQANGVGGQQHVSGSVKQAQV